MSIIGHLWCLLYIYGDSLGGLVMVTRLRYVLLVVTVILCTHSLAVRATRPSGRRGEAAEAARLAR